MFAIVALPPGVTVREASRACRRALDEFLSLAATQHALARWLATSYRDALVGPRAHWATTLFMSPDVASAVLDTQARLERVKSDAQDAPPQFVAGLPRTVIARIHDSHGEVAFAPIDTPGEDLPSRVLALFLAHYLTCPDQYVIPKAR